jgi:hypothetical protein
VGEVDKRKGRRIIREIIMASLEEKGLGEEWVLWEGHDQVTVKPFGTGRSEKTRVSHSILSLEAWKFTVDELRRVLISTQPVSAPLKTVTSRSILSSCTLPR